MSLVHTHPHPPDHVLAKVIATDHSRIAPGRGRQQLRLEFVQGANGRRAHGLEQNRIGMVGARGLPAAIIETRLVPSRELQARIVTFPHEQIAGEHRAVREFPSGIGADDLGTPIEVIEGDLCQEFRPVAVELPPAPGDVAAKPAIAQNRADGVVTDDDQGRDVEALIGHPPVVVGPARGQLQVAHPLAIEARLVDAERRGVKAGAGNAGADKEGAPQARRRNAGPTAAGERPADPLCFPIAAFEQTHFPPGPFGGLGRAIAFVPDPHPPPHALPRTQRLARVGHVRRGVGQHLAGVPAIGFATRLGRNEELKGGLPRPPPMIGVEPPTHARSGIVQAQWILKILATQMNGTASGLRHGVGRNLGRWQ